MCPTLRRVALPGWGKAMNRSVSSARRTRVLSGIVAASVVTVVGAIPVSAAEPGTRDVVVDAIVTVMVGDGTDSTLSALVVADVGGSLLTLPSALAVGLTRGAPIAVTLNAPDTMTDGAALAAAGDGSPQVTVAAVTPTGPDPVLAFADQDGPRTATVLLHTAGAPDASAVPSQVATSLTAWQSFSGGALTISALATSQPFSTVGTCDPGVLANRARTAAGLPAPTGRDLLVVNVAVDCPWRTYATLGGSYLVLNTTATDDERVTHALGHILGLADADAPDTIMSAAGDRTSGSGFEPLDAAHASALGWLVAEQTSAGPWSTYVTRELAVPLPYLHQREALVLADPDRGEIFAQAFYRSGAPRGITLVDLTLDDGVAYSALVAQTTSGHLVELPSGTVVGALSRLLDTIVSAVPAGTDETAPTAPLVEAPADGWLTDPNPRVQWTPAADAGVGLFGYQVLVDGVVVARAYPEVTAITIPTPSRGLHDVAVAAVDLAGNSAAGAPVSVMFGVPDDRLAIDAPAMSAYVRNPVTVTWRPGEALSQPLAGYLVEVDGRAVRFVPPATRSVTLPLFHGPRSITVAAVGLDGGVVTTRSVTVTGDSAPESLFTDITRQNRFVREVFWLAAADITRGFADGSFRPADPIARDAMAAYLYRFPTMDARPTAVPATRPFTDVPTGHQFAREIAWLRDAGITTGFADGRFRGEAPVTREAMAAFLFRFSGVDETYEAPAESPFSDVSVEDTFYREIAWLAETGITTGHPDGTFQPGASVSREAMAAFLYRMADLP